MSAVIVAKGIFTFCSYGSLRVKSRRGSHVIVDIADACTGSAASQALLEGVQRFLVLVIDGTIEPKSAKCGEN